MRALLACVFLLSVVSASACDRAQTSHTADPGVRLAVRDGPQLGRYLTDADGRPLYVSLTDPQRTSACERACLDEWRPVVGAKTPLESAEPAVQMELVGSTQRTDGRVQVTYAGRPLYYRAGSSNEREPERSVKDQWGTWSLLFPHGDPMVPAQ